MAQLPDSTHTTAYQIMRWYESQPQEHRPHMGASIIGHQCERYVWLTWRWALKPEFEGRVLRLFDTGKREEPRLLAELRAIGAEVWDTDPATGDQFRVSACDGHFAGSLDGIAKGVPEAPKSACVLEFKTHSNKSFTDLVAKKVQASKPQHYDQMTVYMGLMEIDRALYMAVNKDTDDLYCEWVHFDQARFDVLLERARKLIGMTTPPERLSADPTHFACKWCGFYKHCHQGVAAEANCRTCCHSSPVENAAWRCDLHGDVIPADFQRKGCDSHLLIPALVPYGEPIDGGESWVAYKHRESGAFFVNGPEGIKDYGPNFSSSELHKCPGALLADMAHYKVEFPGAKVVSGNVTPQVRTPFDDMESDDLDAVPTKPEPASKKAARARNQAFLQAMEQMEGKE